ncbi:MAG: PHP domain-containing protein [Dehalococcoidia bacterium]|nr:PHP domain-containing protein [Dehalococcoidia bacterium]
MSLVDLHIHTTISDGRLSPGEVVALAAERGVRIMAVTDHDTVDGIPFALEAAKKFPSLKVIPGVEISTDVARGEVHVLGYFVDCRNPDLLKFLLKLHNSREIRARKMVAKLADMGFPVKWTHVVSLAGEGSIGRPHIAQAMLEEGLISSFREAFNKYIGRDGPAYVEREKLTPVEVVVLLDSLGYLPVLAHPANIDNLGTLLEELKDAGLVGMEAYYGDYSHRVVQDLIDVADRYGLIPCGGSDFHGLADIGVGAELGSVDVPIESAERLIALADERVYTKK